MREKARRGKNKKNWRYAWGGTHRMGTVAARAVLFLCLLLAGAVGLSRPAEAAVKTSELATTPWTEVARSSIIDTEGWLQGMCATDDYIVCFVNADKYSTEADTLIAFYRNDTDADGNPVEQYGYAFHVTERDYEHGNGMCYNPVTNEIAIAGLFDNSGDDAGAVFLVDADTLRYKGKVQVGSGSMNYFGIDYVKDSNSYVLMANRVADYAFCFADADFSITDILNLHLSNSRSSFQDFIVCGDSIISVPYMQREGYMNVLDVYSIAKQERVGSYYLTLPGHDSFDVEPEGICELEEGHLLMASAVRDTTEFKLYEAYLPLVYSVVTSAENGTITETQLELDEGSDYTVEYGCEDGWRLKSLVVDGEEADVSANPTNYTFTDLTADHTVQAVFEEIPRYTIVTSVEGGLIEENPSAREGESLTVAFSPMDHYELDEILVDGAAVDAGEGQINYTFENLTADHTLEVIYKEIPSYTIHVEAVNGEVGETDAVVWRGDSYTTKVTPRSRYFLARCTVDGELALSSGSDGNITIDRISADHTVRLTYLPYWSLGVAGAAVLFILFLIRAEIRGARRRRRHRERMLELRKKRLAGEMREREEDEDGQDL